MILNYPVDSSLLDPVIENVRHLKATHAPGKIEGMWKKKMLWKPRWVKEWKSSNILKPIWRKFWGPVIIREWVPIPKPPPQWDTQPTQLDTKPVSPSSPFIDSSDSPLSGFSYLQNMIFPLTSSNRHQPTQKFPSYSSDGGLLKSGNYRGPPLPITSGFNSQAETYSGHSSYTSSTDSSAFDLNPPVEQYIPQQPDYGYKGHSVSIIQNSHNAASKPARLSSHTHGHHHHHHHYHHQQHQHQHQIKKPVPHTDHIYNSDQTKFPPDWNAWNPVLSNSYIHSQAQQGSSPVSVISSVKSNPPDTDKHSIDQVSSNFQSGDSDFIQRAPLLSEYHYTESAPQNQTLATMVPQSFATPVTQDGQAPTPHPLPIPVPHSNPLPPSQQNTLKSTWHQATPTLNYQKPPPTSQQRPSSTNHPKTGPTHFHPRHSPTLSHKPQPPKPSKQNFSTPKVVNSVNHPSPKPDFPKEFKIQLNKTAKPVQHQFHKVPDFKALPSTVETFHFIEPFPSNETLTRAALVRNINETESDRINIISPEKVTPYTRKLAEEIVQEHLKISSKGNTLQQPTTVEPITLPTQETKVTVVFPTTSSSIKKTLKAYLAEESISEKNTNVFIVTPVPSEKSEI